MCGGIIILRLTKPNDIRELSNFISQLNILRRHHVGYCGTEVEEIEHTLLNDFSDLPLEKSFVAAYENDSLVGVLGIDVDMESNSAEIWGPFIRHEKWDKLANMMWENLLRQLPLTVNRLNGFYNIENVNGNRFMEQLGACYNGEHTILKIARKITSQKPSIFEITKEFNEKFQALHEEMFPDAYYSAIEMLDKQSDEQKLFIAAHSGELLGYVFCEANPSFAEGDIHFIAVSVNARNKGIGQDLIEKSLEFLFSFVEINEITLCVNSSNEAALKLYGKVGFQEQSRLKSYKCHLENPKSKGEIN